MTTLPSNESELLDRVQQGNRLWERVLQSNYLDADVYDRSVDKISRPLLDDIRNFLKCEQAKFEDRPNTAHTLALLHISLPTSSQREARKPLGLAFLMKGLILMAMKSEKWEEHHTSSEQPVIESALAEITAAIEKEGTAYVAGTGPYSSIYAALLAFLLDEIAIREQLDSLAVLLKDPGVVNQFTEPVMQPGPLFLASYYRGQPHDWVPLPKTLRPRALLTSRIERLKRWLHEITAEARFSAGVGGLNLPSLSKIQWDAIRQHYGFPTSLLDFTTNIEVAAFFATNAGKPGDTGVIYRYHLAHPYALSVLGSLIAAVSEIGGAEMAQHMTKIAVMAVKNLKLVALGNVERIRRQEGIFIQGVGMWAVHNFLQPVYFRQHEGLVYNNRDHNVTKVCLFPSDDPIEKIAAPLVRRFSN